MNFNYQGGNIVTKLIALIVSVLLTFFPDSSFLECKSQELAFPGNETVCKQIAKHIKNNDVESIYNLFCEKDKLSNENLNEQIQKIIDSIDGKILKAERGAGGSQSDYANKGVYQSKRDFVLEVNTTNETYRIYIFWVTVDTESPEKVGLSSLTMYDSERNLVAEAY